MLWRRRQDRDTHSNREQRGIPLGPVKKNHRRRQVAFEFVGLELRQKASARSVCEDIGFFRRQIVKAHRPALVHQANQHIQQEHTLANPRCSRDDAASALVIKYESGKDPSIAPPNKHCRGFRTKEEIEKRPDISNNSVWICLQLLLGWQPHAVRNGEVIAPRCVRLY